MKIFVSYARVDKPYCTRIADMLDIHEVWYDYRMYAGANWWREIVSRLEWCEAFIYLLSSDSVNSHYCQKEFEIAIRLGKKILPVLIDEGMRHKLPESLQELHYADLTGGLTPQAFKLLFNSIYLLERQRPSHLVSSSPDIRKFFENDNSPDSPTTIIGKAADAMDAGEYDQALFLLRNAKQKGRYDYIDLDALIADAEIGLEKRTTQKKIDLEYKTIAELIRRKRTRRLGCQAFNAFRREHPKYDPDRLAPICAGNVQTAIPGNIRLLDEQASNKPGSPMPESPQVATSTATKTETRQRRVPATLPLLEWVFVPAGTTFNVFVESFYSSKYPITNEQFERFLRDPRGYRNETWWRFSAYALDWFRKNPKPRPPRFPFANHPRENVSWYEAVAFTNWLSARLGKRVTLPNQAQWRRAASGNDNRIYPWGNTFDSNCANTRMSTIRQTTPVTKYDGGKSIYGIYDMAGNVWEWCLNASDEAPDSASDLTVFRDRALLGGSWNTGSAHIRADKEFYWEPRYYFGTIGFRVVILE